MRRSGLYLLICILLIISISSVDSVSASSIDGIQIFPPDYVWNVPVDTLPIHLNSSDFIESEYGSYGKIIPAFGYGTNGSPNGPVGNGYTYDTVDSSTPKYHLVFKYPRSSFTGIQYPIPFPRATIHGAGDDGLCDTGDCNAIIIDRDTKLEYEFFGMTGTQFPNGSWYTKSAGIFNLSNYSLTNRGTATASGSPLLVGVIRYDEVKSGSINHAVRLALPFTRYGWNNYTWPAVFGNSIYVNNVSTNYPRMGERFRLNASFDISGFSPTNQVILTAMKKYGMILTDNGGLSPIQTWQISGMKDPRWNWSDLVLLNGINGTSFEAVDESSLMIDENSGQVWITPGVSQAPTIPMSVPDDETGNFWNWTIDDASSRLRQKFL
jgi:hypothetical protein